MLASTPSRRKMTSVASIRRPPTGRRLKVRIGKPYLKYARLAYPRKRQSSLEAPRALGPKVLNRWADSTHPVRSAENVLPRTRPPYQENQCAGAGLVLW